ncbi:MAG TPA: LysR family transcriptional regulator [Beijerinckiaceae bacterium]|nr:LysR family transcriptional regulator [Beijerinckiaceae bacterium]
MNLTQLRYFVAIARNRSFSRAAVELHVAQPALTRHIRLLEDELDGTLFVRHQKGVELTDFGKLLLERAELQIRSFDQMQEDIQARSLIPSGRLRIGCPPALTGRLLSDPVRSFLKLYPRISIEVREGISDQLARDVFTDTLDIAIASLISAPAHLLAERLFKEEIWIFTSQNAYLPSRITPKFLSSVPLLAARRSNVIRDLLDGYASQAGIALTPVVETDSTQLNEDLIEAGIGYAIAPKFSLIGKTHRLQLKGRPIPGLFVNRCLIRRKDRPESRAAREFSTLVKTTVKEAPWTETV